MERIAVEHLTKNYGFGRGVFDVSFKINKGEVFGFLGPNGAGKSTTIRHLMGFSKPDSGMVKVLGVECFNNYDKFMNRVGYLPGEIALPTGINGYEFLNLMKKMKNITDDTRLNYLMDLFELDPSGETKSMSLGVKRKLAVVTAFMHDPDILILDEPTSGLDLKMQQNFIKFIKEEKQRGKTILLSSHIFSEIEATCDRIAIIKEGKIVSEFLTEELKHKKDKIYQITFLKEEDKIKFLKLQNTYWLNNDITNKKIEVLVNDTKVNYLIAKLSKYPIEDFAEQKETLEDYFMKYYKKEKKFGGNHNDKNPKLN